MKIAISGSNGYIANNLIKSLENQNIEIIRIDRKFLKDIDRLVELLSGASCVINLAGAPILQRWTEGNKEIIRNSRTESTSNITKAINKLSPENRPKLFISASAIGIYSANTMHTEESNSFAEDFVGSVVKDWENASANLSPDVRKVIFRIGIVIGKESKTIQNLLPVFKMGLGGKVSSGLQSFPFIHISDVTNAFLWAINTPNSAGIYNLVAPENIDNKTFSKALAKVLHRPLIFTIPSFILKIALGNASSLLLSSPQAYPKRLLDEGFNFSFPDIITALEEITG
jgi:TIGR01777 family protein